MTINSFPNCCAISLLSGFGNTHTSIYQNSTKEEVVEFILNARMNDTERIQLIVLNEVQLKYFTEKTFIDLKFKITNIGLYTGHGNNIYLLTYNRND